MSHKEVSADIQINTHTGTRLDQAHTRRLKCNRCLPCDTCVKREKSSLCSYAANAVRNKPLTKPRDIRDRLNSLENLVSSLVRGDAVIQPESGRATANALGGTPIKETPDLSSTIKEPTKLAPETPHLQETSDGQVNYIDPSHWQSVLDDIKEVREQLSLSDGQTAEEEQIIDSNRLSLDAGVWFGSVQGLSTEDILTSLPSKSTCDVLLSWYFNCRFMVLGIALLSHMIQ